MFDLTTAVVVYCGLVAALYLGVWLYYDRRDSARFDRPRRKHVFFCVRCNEPYAAATDAERVPCPRCGYENSRLRF
ncbi:MAG: hydrogenase nickel incorporation protein HypA [Opitutaceae bacterium]|nr:hydrogenase nickel incorporation protein HypA [Opitutaceae bacterium]